MSSLHHVVTFKPGTSTALGVDDYDHFKSSVRSARFVLRYVQRPREGEDFVSKHAIANYESAIKFLEELGDAAVSINAFGIVVGEYSVSPYLISMKEFATLRMVYS